MCLLDIAIASAARGASEVVWSFGDSETFQNGNIAPHESSMFLTINIVVNVP